jgi:hypothetical protein
VIGAYQNPSFCYLELALSLHYLTRLPGSDRVAAASKEADSGMPLARQLGGD